MNLTIDQIIAIVSRETGVSANDIKKDSRKEKTVLARHLSMWACRWYTKNPMQKIASAHGKNQHGTVINACTSIESQSRYNSKIKTLCENIVNQIK